MNYLSEQSENDDYRKPTKMTDPNILKIPKNVRLRFCRENFSSKQPVADPLFTGAQSAILKLSTGICMVCLFSNLSAFMRAHSNEPDEPEISSFFDFSNNTCVSNWHSDSIMIITKSKLWNNNTPTEISHTPTAEKS